MIAHSRIKAQRAHSTALSRESFSRAPRIVLRAVTPEQVGLGFVLLAPGTAALIYSAIRGKGNVGDGFSHLLTIVSQGYLQPEAGGKDIPVATGDLSEFGDSYIGFLYNMYAINLSDITCQRHIWCGLCWHKMPKCLVNAVAASTAVFQHTRPWRYTCCSSVQRLFLCCSLVCWAPCCVYR